MAWDLSANYSLELMRHDMAARVGADADGGAAPAISRRRAEHRHGATSGPRSRTRSAAATGRSPSSRPPTGLSHLRGLRASARRAAIAVVRDLLLGGGRTEALGSNNWVVDGTLTASGKPLLANDPHLGTQHARRSGISRTCPPAISTSSARRCPARRLWRSAATASSPGAKPTSPPTSRICFSSGSTPSGTTAEFQGVQEPMRDRPGNDRRQGRRADSARRPHHPPRSAHLRRDQREQRRVDDRARSPPPLEPLAFRWTALDEERHDHRGVSAAERGAQLERVHAPRSATSSRRRRISSTRTWTATSATTRPAAFRSARAATARSPAEGWTGDAEWIGWIPFEELPHAFDPPQHFIVTANNRPMPADYPHLIALEYPEPYRAQRITDLLQRRTGADARRFPRHPGRHALAARPGAAAAAAPSRAGRCRARRARRVDLLRQWNFNAAATAPPRRSFRPGSSSSRRRSPATNSGRCAAESYEGRFSYITRFVTNVADAPARARGATTSTTPARRPASRR